MRIHTILRVCTIALAIGSPARAQTNLTWDVNGAAAGTGGTGTWNTTNALWFNGTTFVPWTNGTFDNAIFGGTTGTVTVSGTIDVHNITLSTSPYTLTGGALNLGGATPTIVGTGTIGSVLTGSGGMVTGGTPGTLTLSGANTFTGPLTIRNGVTAFATGSVILGPTGSLATTAITIGNASAGVSVNTFASLQNQANNQLSNAVVTFDGLFSRFAYWQLLGTAQSVIGIVDTSANGVVENTESQIGIGNSTLTLTGAGSYSFNGYLRDNIGGSGTLALVKTGAGTQTLSGPNISDTGATTVNGGTLTLFNATGYRSVTTVNSGATLEVAGTINLGYPATFSFTLNNGSTLTSANTGWTAFDSSNVAINGAVAINVTNNGNQLFIGGASTGLTGSGTINLTNTGTATTGLTLRNGPGSFSGAMNVSGGVLNIGSGASLALQNTDLNLTNSARLNLAGASFAAATSGSVKSLAGNSTATVALGAQTLTLGTNNGTGATFAGVISGTGALVKTGTGTQTLTGNNTYTGTTTISAGTLQVGSGGTSGTLGTGAISDNASLVFNRSNLLTVANAISGTGSLTQAGSGTTILTGANGYGGTTTISAGTLQVGSGSTTGTLGTGAVINDAALRFNRSNTLTVANAISGTGTVTQAGTGTTILSGVNTYFGGTLFNAGTLQVSADDNLGNAAGGLTFNGGTLQNTAAFTSARTVTLTGTGTFQTDADLTLSGVTSGAGALTKTGAGSLILTGANTYSGTTTISAGTLQVGSGGTTGTLGTGAISNNAGLVFNRSDALTVANDISGTGTVTQAGAGTTSLTGANTYSGTTTIGAGTLQVGDGGTSGTLGTAAVSNNAGLVFNRSNTLTVANAISGTGSLTQAGSGTTILTGSNSYAGASTVAAGTLWVNGDQSAATGATGVASGGTLGGTGTVGGDVSVAGGGTLAPGNSPGTLTINGNLSLAGGSLLDYEFGQSGTVGGPLNDLTNVGGNLVLDGTINVTVSAGGSFTTGLYRVINYGGTLTNNGLALGALPAGSAVSVQTSIANQVNLVNTAGLALNFWDGAAGPKNDSAVNGGNGVWQSGAGNDNWTDTSGALNAPSAGAFAIFAAAPGTVTIDNGLGAVTASGMQFAANGYTITGDALTLTGPQSTFRVGDSTAAGAGFTATINSALTGATQLAKADLGTLVLSGTNTYTGGTLISAGTLRITSDVNLGAVAGGLSFDGGTLQNTAAFTTARTVTLTGTGTFQTDADLTLAGVASGAGGLTKTGAGSLMFTGANTYSGTTTISAGTLQVGNGATSGTLGTGNLVNNAALIFNRSDATSYAGGVSGTGTVTKDGGGALTLTGASTYTGTTSVNAGTLFVNGSLGNTAVTVASGATLAGSGSIAGATTIAGGATLAPGATSGTTSALATGALTLSGTSLVAYDLGAANVIGAQNDVTNVTGNLTLDGTINITNAGNFASMPGSYRLFSYTGALTNNTLAVGTTPGYAVGEAVVQTIIPGKVNLVVASGMNVAFWDGPGSVDDSVIAGGTQTWDTTTGRWTNVEANINQTWLNGMAIFEATGGTVTLGANLQARALQFSSNGYVIDGGGFSLQMNALPSGAAALIRVDPGVTTTINAALTGTNGLNKADTGTLILGGANTYSGTTTITGGVLRVNGTLTSSPVVVTTGTTLGGSGTITGAVTIDASGTLAPGNSVGTLTVGTLNLLPGAILDYELATPGVIGGGVNDLIEVTGALTLDGALNATALTGFGIGAYRLIDYGGLFTNNGLDLGLLPAGFVYQIQTSVPGQVNLLVSTTPDPLQYWNGSTFTPNGVVNGGTGTWVAGQTNWTNAAGATATTWGDVIAVFQGTAGTVTVEGAIAFAGLRFLTSGYTLRAGTGGALTPSGQAVILVNAGASATIDVPITGSGGLVLQGGGTLTLSGANSYRGGTTIGDGVLSISSDGNLGDPSGGLTFDGGTLQTTANLTSSRAVTIGTAGGTIDTIGGSTFVLESAVGGPGTLSKAGDGLLVLAGDNTYSGGTAIHGGTLQVGNCGTSGAISGNVINNSVLVFSRSDTATYEGSISGSGGVIKNCSGTQILRGTNSYSGGTLINTGTLVGDTQSLQGDIVDNSALVFDQDADGTFHGVLFGSGTLSKTGSGTVLLTGAHALQGVTTVHAGTLALDGTLPGAVTVMRGATFDATGAIGGPLTVDGTVSVRSPESGGFGLLGVGGPVTFAFGSRYGVTIGASGTNSGLVTRDRASVDGAVIDVRAQAEEYGRVTHYAIMRADSGLTGRAGATSSAENLDPIVSQNTTTLFLTVLRTDLPLQPFSVTANGWGIGGAIDNVKAGATGDLGAVVRELTALDDPALGRALDVVSGEIHASAVQLAAIDGESIMDVIRSELAVRLQPVAREDIAIGSTGAAPWGARDRRGWIRLRTERASFDSGLSTDGQGSRRGAHGGDGTLHGFAIGADWPLTPQWLLGVGGSYATGRLTLDEIDERSDFSAPRGFVYVGYARPRWALNGGFSVARAAYERRRAFAFTAIGPTGAPLFGGVEREATSDPSGLATELWAEARFESPVGRWTLQPAAGVRAARFGIGDWQETGADALSLRAASQAIHSTQADGGLRVSRAVGQYRPYFGGLYRRELSSGRTAATLQIGEGTGGLYEVDGVSLAKDLVAGQAGLFVLRDRFSVTVGYEARHSRQQTRQTVQLGVGF